MNINNQVLYLCRSHDVNDHRIPTKNREWVSPMEEVPFIHLESTRPAVGLVVSVHHSLRKNRSGTMHGRTGRSARREKERKKKGCGGWMVRSAPPLFSRLPRRFTPRPSQMLMVKYIVFSTYMPSRGKVKKLFFHDVLHTKPDREGMAGTARFAFSYSYRPVDGASVSLTSIEPTRKKHIFRYIFQIST